MAPVTPVLALVSASKGSYGLQQFPREVPLVGWNSGPFFKILAKFT